MVQQLRENGLKTPRQEKKCSSLPLEAQMNCKACIKAHKCQCECGSPWDEAFRLGNDAVQLHVQEKTVNSRCKSSMRLAASREQIVDKIRRDCKWAPDTINVVNWKAHGRVLNKNHQQWEQIVKFVHKQLPTAKKNAPMWQTNATRVPIWVWRDQKSATCVVLQTWTEKLKLQTPA